MRLGNKAGGWSWALTDWLAPLSGSVRAAEQDFSCEATLGVGWEFSSRPVCQLSACLKPRWLCSNINIFHPCMLKLTSSSCLFYKLIPYGALLLPICCFPFPAPFWPSLSLSLRSALLPPLLTLSFTPPFHPSNTGRQQNDIQGVMVTSSPLLVVTSCYCLCVCYLLAPVLY